MNKSVKNKIINNARLSDNFLKKYLNSEKKSLLIEPMKFGILGGGKKIRSSIILNTGKIFNIESKKYSGIKYLYIS